MREHDVDVLDSSIHYTETGSGDPIVFLHGNPTSSYLWRNVVPRLAGEGRCLAPDLIGVGKSEQVAEWCLDTFKNLEVRKIGPGLHYVQEDHPETIGDAIKEWRRPS